MKVYSQMQYLWINPQVFLHLPCDGHCVTLWGAQSQIGDVFCSQQCQGGWRLIYKEVIEF